jgi:hypothetical protein
MKNCRGWEAGKYLIMVSDRGDRCLFAFKCCRRLFFDVFQFPFRKAKLIGDWHDKRRCAPILFGPLLLLNYFCSVRSANRGCETIIV